MFVLTIDQRDSTHQGDRVPELLQFLARVSQNQVVLDFDRTAGDEIQGVIADPRIVLDCVRAALRLGDWYVGIGVGAVATPLPASTREASGGAFVHARRAVDRAKRPESSVPVAVEADDSQAAADAESLLRLLGAITMRRSKNAWQAIDVMSEPTVRTQIQAAELIGISRAAVSQRLRAAFWSEEIAALPPLTALIAKVDQ